MSAGNALPSIGVYGGIVLVVVGIVALVHPTTRLNIPSRTRAGFAIGAGLLMTIACLHLPAPVRMATRDLRMNEFLPRFQFSEQHSIEIDAAPADVYRAMREVRADEVRFFRLLTWLRRFGRDAPVGILNPKDVPLIDAALQSGFMVLAEVPGQELVLGTAVIARRGNPPQTTEAFKAIANADAGGYALAAMNFDVVSERDVTRLTTETRVYATSERPRRNFGRYWRIIYPGSAIIRRSWLQAIKRRAEAAVPIVESKPARQDVPSSPFSPDTAARSTPSMPDSTQVRPVIGDSTIAKPIIKKDGADYQLLLPRAMYDALQAHDSTFKPWRMQTYPTDLLKYASQIVSERSALSAVVGDFNGDGVDDVVMEGAGLGSTATVVVMSSGRAFNVSDLFRRESSGEHAGTGWNASHLTFQGAGRIVSHYEESPLELTTDAFVSNYYEKTASIQYYRNGSWHRYTIVD